MNYPGYLYQDSMFFRHRTETECDFCGMRGHPSEFATLCFVSEGASGCCQRCYEEYHNSSNENEEQEEGTSETTVSDEEGAPPFEMPEAQNSSQ